MWAPQYCAAADLNAWLGVSETDPQINAVIEAASRAVDQACSRQFGQSDSQTMVYTPVLQQGKWYVETDDMFASPTSVRVQMDDGSLIQTISSWVQTPRNAVLKNRPFTFLEFTALGSDPWWFPYTWTYPTPMRYQVAVTGVFGWPEVPESIHLATLMQAARFYERQSTVMPLTSQRVDDVAYSFNQLDPDIATSVAQFKRYWSVAE